jgi:large-conductance mechanosensitive channel
MNRFQNFDLGLKNFIIDNGIVGAVAGVSIGISTNEVIKSLVGDIIIPFFIIVFCKLNLKQFTKLLPGRGKFDFISFLKHFISWIIVLVISFVFLKTAFQNIIGVPLKKTGTQTQSHPQNQSQSQTQNQITQAVI